MDISGQLETAESPRSTVVPASATPGLRAKASKKIMTQEAEEAAAAQQNSNETEPNGGGGNNDGSPGRKESPAGHQGGDKDDKKEGVLSPTPQPHMNSYSQVYPAHLTPQPGAGYYLGYGQSQVTPEPPSPAGPGPTVYDVGSFFQQPAAFAHNSPFGVPQTPLSPRRSGGMGGIPPASPLFPRVSAAGAAGLVPTGAGLEQRPGGAPPSPSVPYHLSPPLGPNAMYQNYPGNGMGNQGDSPDDIPGWGDRNQQNNGFPPGSPQVNAQGMPVPYVPGMARGGRSYSFEETMLPPSADQGQQGNPAYSPSPYGHNQNNAASGGTLFAHDQPWGYAGGPTDMYGAPASPLQPRPVAQMPVYPGQMGGGMRQQHMGLYGQYYPATSPGPPIQTTESNKGPDGANLFIFHIPNHFTNLDMYNLFCPYGNLLSVRIMVEKDTGRSRGFGFVSYDAPASAALAIKELNGFAIGNKRLKVQHKQIRSSDQQHRDSSQGFYTGADGNFPSGGYSSHLPPSGPMAAQNMTPSPWYEPQNEATPPNAPGVEDGTGDVPPDNNATHSPVPEGGPDAVLGQGDGMAPLSNLEPLRNALPDE